MAQLPYVAAGRRCLLLREEAIVFLQERLVFGGPPGRWTEPIRILLVLAALPWTAFLAGAPGPLFGVLAGAWSLAFLAAGLALRRWREGRVREFEEAVAELGARVDLAGGPAAARVFLVRFEPAGVRLVGPLERPDPGAVAPLLHEVPLSRVRLAESGGYDLPWSDLNQGEPHDFTGLDLVVDGAPLPDLEGRFPLGTWRPADRKAQERARDRVLALLGR